MPWKCGRLPERKSNPITVFPTGLALLETLYPKWGTLSRVFRLSATAGSLFLYSFPFRGGGGCGVQVQKIPHLGYIYRQLYCAADVLQKKRWSCRAGEKRIEIDTGGGLV